MPLSRKCKFAICQEIFGEWPFAKAAEYAASLGYNGIELAPFLFPARDAAVRRKILDSARAAGLEICGLHWLLAKTEGLHLTNPDSVIQKNTSDYLGELVDFCADVGGRTLTLGSPQQRSNSFPNAWQNAQQTLREPIRRAADRGVIICLEPLGRNETDFINTAADAIRFAGELDSPSFKMMLDVKAMCNEALSIPQIIRASWPHFAHFHANDKNRKGPGFGDVDFRPIAAALGEVGYDGYVSVEVFDFTEGPEVIATRSLAYLKDVFQPCSIDRPKEC